MKLKCNNCNVVINELLAYLVNKLSIADEDSLVRICASTFSTEQVEEATNLLVDSIPPGPRRTGRKGKGRENRILHDMISLLKSTDPDILPVFVARDLENLPPITFDHLDVSKLLKDLAVLQAEVKHIKSSYVTMEQFQGQLKGQCLGMESSSPPFSAVKVNMKRGAYRDSGPIALSQLDDEIILNADTSLYEAKSPKDRESNLKSMSLIINQKEGSKFESDESIQRPTDRSVSSVDNERAASQGCGGAGDVCVSSQPLSAPCDPSIMSAATRKQKSALSFAEVTKAEGEWKMVQRKKNSKYSYRYLGTLGISDDKDSNFKAADRKLPIFITKVHKETTVEDITEYIRNKTKEIIKLEKISLRD